MKKISEYASAAKGRGTFGAGVLLGWWAGLAVGGLGGTILGAAVTAAIVRAAL